MRPVSLNNLRIAHSVALRNAGYAALKNAAACSEYPTGHRFAYVRETLDGTEFWECPCGREAMNAREANLPLMGEDDPHWGEMQAYAGEFRKPLPRTAHVHTFVLGAHQPQDVPDTREVCTVCGFTRDLMPWEVEEARAAAENPLAGETSTEWARRMGGHA